MKKILVSFLAFLLIFSLTACGGKTSEKENTSKKSDKQSAESAEKGALLLNGAELKSYKLIYDADDLYARFATKSLQSYISQLFGVKLQMYDDNSKETELEILLGDTSRSLSAKKVEGVKGDTYAILSDGKKIALKAEGYMIGGAAGGIADMLIAAQKDDGSVDLKIEAKSTLKKYEFKKAKNALLYIGDGMGQSHIDWALADGMPKFYAADMPNIGEAVTYSYSVKPLGEAKYTDSAAAGTALATGYKTKNGVIGLDHNLKTIKNIRELAAERGAKTAVITTDLITGATPSAFLAHTTDRGNTEDIQKQIDALKDGKKVDYAEGSISGQLCFTSQGVLDKISGGNEGFFMMLEEGQIDQKSHTNDGAAMISTVERFNETICYAMQFALVRGDTVLIVTADHETGGVKQNGNSFSFTTTEHTNRNVPLFAMGYGTEIFKDKATDNTDIPKFIAKIFGESAFGNNSVPMAA